MILKHYHKKSDFPKYIIDYLIIRINEHWSLEQISNRSANVIHKILSTSTIYRLIHAKKLPKTSIENLKY